MPDGFALSCDTMDAVVSGDSYVMVPLEGDMHARSLLAGTLVCLPGIGVLFAAPLESVGQVRAPLVLLGVGLGLAKPGGSGRFARAHHP